MTEQTCRCGKPTRNAAYFCDDCAQVLFVALGEVPWLDGELETTIGGQKAASYTGSSSRGAEVPSPVNWGASEARTHLRAVLVSWVRFCADEAVRNTSPHLGLPPDDLPAISRWLMWRVDGLALLDIGPEAVDEITDAVTTCRRFVDRPPELKYAGPCDCGRDVYHRPGATQAYCRECGETHDVGERYTWMKSQVMGRLVTAREGATLLSRFDLETQQGTIDKWRERGRLVEKGHNPTGQRLYLFDDLIDLATRRVRQSA
jgi:hypothetical protein